MSFLLKKVESFSTSDDLSTKDINPKRDLPKLEIFKGIESDDDDEIVGQAVGGTCTQTTRNVRNSDSKVRTMFIPPKIDFFLSTRFIYCQMMEVCGRKARCAFYNIYT